jgi:hypothetical protein
VTQLTNGVFEYEGGIWDGRRGDMGPAAALQVGSLQLCIATHATYEWCGEQMKSLSVDTAGAQFVVAKNPMNYSMAFPNALGRLRTGYSRPNPSHASPRTVLKTATAVFPAGRSHSQPEAQDRRGAEYVMTP